MDFVSTSDIKNIKKIKINYKNIIKIANFIAINFKHYGHSYEYKRFYYEQINIFNLINSYGYGNCKHYAFLFAFFMDLMGVKNDLLYLSNKKKKFEHLVNLIYFSKYVYFIDCDFKIISKNGQLIKYNKKEISNYLIKNKFSILNNCKNKKELDKKDLINKYIGSLDKVQKYNIYEIEYPYKKHLREYFSKNYFFNEPNFIIPKNQNLKIKNLKTKYGILNSKMKKIDCSQNKSITFNKINNNEFSINNFQFPIIDVKIELSKKSDLFFFHNKKYFFKKKKFNLKKLRIISPLKSFKILSKEKIKNVEIIFLISKFRLKFKNFLKTLT